MEELLKKNDNIRHITWVWREQISFQEEMIDKINNPKLASKLKKELNKSIEKLISQNMFSQIMNIPDTPILGVGDNPRNLPVIYEE